MKFITLFVFLASLVLSLSVSAQSATTGSSTAAVAPPLPSKFSFYLYPDNRSGRGHMVEISDVMAKDDKQVNAKITMYGMGQDKCRIQGYPAVGMFEGDTLLLKADIKPGDNLTCVMSFELTRTADGQFKGRYKNSAYTGGARPD